MAKKRKVRRVRKRAKKKDYWIPEDLRKGRVRRYIKRTYGNRGFTKDGKIKLEYLNKAEERAEKKGNESLARAIRLAKTLKRIGRKK